MLWLILADIAVLWIVAACIAEQEWFSRLQCWFVGHDYVYRWCNRCGKPYDDEAKGAQSHE